MTDFELLSRLFDLASRIAAREIASGYSGIAEIKGSSSWSFLEHLTELPEGGRAELLRALVKRRFAIEGLRVEQTSLSSTEQLEVEHWLKHSNSMHGTRHAPFFAFSVREEEISSQKSNIALASRAAIRATLRNGLLSASYPIEIVTDSKRELKWRMIVRAHVRVAGWLDLGRPGEQAAAFVAVYDPEATQPKHVPTSFLGILGIGESSWSFLEQGQEYLLSDSTIRFFLDVCGVMQE